MKSYIRQFTHLTVVAIAMIIFTSAASAQIRAYRVTDRQVQTLLNRIENQANTFKNRLDRSLDRSSIDGTRQEDSINYLVAQFEAATDRLKSNFDSRRSTAADVQEVLMRAVPINRFMVNNNLQRNAQQPWNSLRNDLNTLAGYYNVRADWNAAYPVAGQQPVYRVADREVQSLIQRLENSTDRFKNQLGRALDNSNLNNSRREDSMNSMVSEFESATNRLKDNFNGRRSTAADVQDVFNRGALIDRFMRNNRLNTRAENTWTQIRGDLNTLAGYYSVSANWDYVGTPAGPVWNNTGNTGGQWAGGNFDTQLTGSYRLNTSLSDNVSSVVDRAIINARYNNNRPNVKTNLERRLSSPQMITLEKRGTQVTMSTGNQAPVNFSADGRSVTETSPNGRTVTTRVVSTNRDLTINYEGDRMNDFYVSFTPVSNGQLRVTRRVYIENQNETVTVNSVYDKVSSAPQWNTGAGTGTGWVGGNSGGFIIPNNTTIAASLNTPLSTRTVRDGDRFSMTIDAPSQFNGAIIEGRVIGERSGVVSGRANMSLSFETIRLRNGQTYQFAGIVTQVRETNGNIVDVNNEGSVQDSSQTTKTVTRAGIGAVLGAVIGAIAGGGQGAAIGAGVGAGAGAGTVILQGRDNLELTAGAQFTITATAPANIGMR